MRNTTEDNIPTETKEEITQSETKKPLFRDIDADDDAPEISEIESLCLACEETGVTRLLLTKIPFFKEVIIMSFECSHCGFKNNEIQPASTIQVQGIRYTLKVNDSKMMNRQVVKQASSMFRIEELDFEAPPFTSTGVFTTVEGLFHNAITGLEQQQPVRKAIDPDLAVKVDKVIEKLKEHSTGAIPFTLILEDISGNSFIENSFAPEEDPYLIKEHFDRTKLQDEKLGMYENEIIEEQKHDPESLKDEVLEFPINCMSCQSPTTQRMKVINIPHFKEVIIMAMTCDVCGEKSNEVKAGGVIETMGTRIIFKMTDISDLSRDVLTSQMCSIEIPEFDISLQHSSSAGNFTTVEGLLVNIKKQLGNVNPFVFGDSSEKKDKLSDILRKLDSTISGEHFTTIILDDPVGNSYLQNAYAPDPDPELTIKKYERTHEQNEELGLNDIKTEDYR